MPSDDDLKAEIVAMVKHDEGFRGELYKDTEGFLTIGFGFCLDKMPMPENVAEFWLMEIIKERSNRLSMAREKDTYRELNTPRKCAILNMCYQMGVKGCLGFNSMWDALKARDYARAAKEALNSKWARQTPNRAKRIAEVIRSGKMTAYWG